MGASEEDEGRDGRVVKKGWKEERQNDGNLFTSVENDQVKLGDNLCMGRCHLLT